MGDWIFIIKFFLFSIWKIIKLNKSIKINRNKWKSFNNSIKYNYNLNLM